MFKEIQGSQLNPIYQREHWASSLYSDADVNSFTGGPTVLPSIQRTVVWIGDIKLVSTRQPGNVIYQNWLAMTHRWHIDMFLSTFRTILC
jgi:hypothetical protein